METIYSNAALNNIVNTYAQSGKSKEEISAILRRHKYSNEEVNKIWSALKEKERKNILLTHKQLNGYCKAIYMGKSPLIRYPYGAWPIDMGIPPVAR